MTALSVVQNSPNGGNPPAPCRLGGALPITVSPSCYATPLHLRLATYGPQYLVPSGSRMRGSGCFLSFELGHPLSSSLPLSLSLQDPGGKVLRPTICLGQPDAFSDHGRRVVDLLEGFAEKLPSTVTPSPGISFLGRSSLLRDHSSAY